MRVSETVLYGNRINLRNSAHQVFSGDTDRVVLPVKAFLIEHPAGRFLVDTGWPRELSPRGEYDPKAVRALLPRHLAQFYRPWVPQGATIREQLEELGLKPSDLDAAFTGRNWEERITPGFGFDPTLQRRGLEWIAAQAARPGCRAILTSHDPDQEPGVAAIEML